MIRAAEKMIETDTRACACLGNFVRRGTACSGDSTNDAPMFSYFTHTAGVSTVVEYLPQLPALPRWITQGPGGSGFVEFADAILRTDPDNRG
ncbi:hypothetical protein VL15_27740 [Burkholderia cepacia]|uniref:Uncharacterized protein n=1 Tax=Burkholderia cepacia TaxID=292 RepID=A0A0J5WC90_BURCE|nr:hypothetical protein VL15_27740 [Burkholderia cepacia]